MVTLTIQRVFQEKLTGFTLANLGHEYALGKTEFFINITYIDISSNEHSKCVL